MTPTARERQIAEALIEERIARITPTPRELQVARHLGALERIREEGLPGLPGGPPLAGERPTLLGGWIDTPGDFVAKMIEDGLAGDLPEPQPWVRDLYEAGPGAGVQFLKNRSGPPAGDAVFTWAEDAEVRIDGEQLLVNSFEIDWKIDPQPSARDDHQLDAYRYMMRAEAGLSAISGRPVTCITGLAA